MEGLEQVGDGGAVPLDTLPDGVLAVVLGFLTPTEAVAVSLASRRLCQLVAEGGPWLQQPGLGSLRPCIAEGLAFPLTYHAVFGSNLLRNPSFSRDANYSGPRVDTFDTAAWVVTVRGGSGCTWEQPVVGLSAGAGCPPPPLAPAAAPPPPPGGSCLATSFGWSEIVQAVDLVGALVDAGLGSRALAEGVLDSGVPLCFSVWVGARCDCGGVFSVEVVLDNGGWVLPVYTPHLPFGAQSPWTRPAEGREFQYQHSGEAHEVDKDTWSNFTEVIEGYPPGARRALVVLRGKDTQYWMGNYGAKFASAELRFLPEAPATQ